MIQGTMQSTMHIQDGVLTLQGDLTYATVAQHFKAVDTARVERVDLSALGQVDSSALGLLLAIKRRALVDGRAVQIEHWPSGLVDLARLYGVFELL